MTTQTIINAISVALKQTSATVVYEDEVKQGFQDDSIFINVISCTYTPKMNTCKEGRFSFDVIYYTDSKTAAYDMANVLLDLLKEIETEDGRIRGSNISFRYTGDSLHFLITYNVSLFEVAAADPYMMNVKTEESVK